jgi:sulfite reductase (ferredoxin)
VDISQEPDAIVSEFRKYFYDTELFFDPFVKGKFASYLFNAYEQRNEVMNLDRTRQLIEEARLFIEAAHECNTRMVQAGITSPGSFKKWLMDRQLQLSGS